MGMSRWSTQAEEQPARPYPSLLCWVEGYAAFCGEGSTPPDLNSPSMTQWKGISLGGMKRLIVSLGEVSQTELNEYIRWYWQVYVPRMNKVLGKRFVPNTPASKSFQNQYDQFRKWKGSLVR